MGPLRFCRRCRSASFEMRTCCPGECLRSIDPTVPCNLHLASERLFPQSEFLGTLCGSVVRLLTGWISNWKRALWIATSYGQALNKKGKKHFLHRLFTNKLSPYGTRCYENCGGIHHRTLSTLCSAPVEFVCISDWVDDISTPVFTSTIVHCCRSGILCASVGLSCFHVPVQ